MKNKLLMLATILLLISCYEKNNKPTDQCTNPLITSFAPGEIWNDSKGDRIKAHNGSVLYHEGVYYWYGEYTLGQISCYSSKDLLNWTLENVFTPTTQEPSPDPDTNPVIKSPRVVYNEKTRKFVMWMLVSDTDNATNNLAVAISSHPTEKFKYVNSKQVANTVIDHTLFVDEDKSVYHFYSTLHNGLTRMNMLTQDYLKPVNTSMLGPNKTYSVFKHNNKYYQLSATDDQNTMIMAADRITGPWTTVGNPFIGPDADNTFHSQNTAIIPVQGKEGIFIATFDRDEKLSENPGYVWLPVIFVEDKPTIPWYDNWDMTVFIK